MQYELGCYADGANGNVYVNTRAIELAESVQNNGKTFNPYPDGCDCGCGLILAKCDYFDDIATEAVEWLNEYSGAKGYWSFEDGDLMLMESEVD